MFVFSVVLIDLWAGTTGSDSPLFCLGLHTGETRLTCRAAHFNYTNHFYDKRRKSYSVSRQKRVNSRLLRTRNRKWLPGKMRNQEAQQETPQTAEATKLKIHVCLAPKEPGTFGGTLHLPDRTWIYRWFLGHQHICWYWTWRKRFIR